MSTNESEMTAEQQVKAKVRKILRDYMKTPGATMETDVFMAMVNELIAAKAQGFREGVEAAIDAVRKTHFKDAEKLTAAIRSLTTNEGK